MSRSSSAVLRTASSRITVWTDAGDKITLNGRDFVARGGEGSVFARGDTGYKIAHDPNDAIAASKIAELDRIAHADVLTPRGRLRQKRGRGTRHVGHTFRFIPNAWSACELIPVAFTRRHALGREVMPRVVTSIRERVAAVHAAGCLVVDLNELNVLVASDFGRTYLIDTDSFATGSHPASAIMPSVADPTRPLGETDSGTDWFSFAVLAFSLLIGIHPYRGKHPVVRGLMPRMKAGISVFDPEVRLPAACRPLATLPDDWRAWFDDVFVNGERSPAPRLCGASSGRTTVALGSAPTTPALATAARAAPLRREHVASFGGPLRWVFETGTGHRLVAAGNRLLLDGDEVGSDHEPATAWCSSSGRPLLAWIRGGSLCIFDPAHARDVPVDARPSQLACAGGRLFALAPSALTRIDAVDLGDQTVATATVVAPVVSRAARLWPGVLVQNALGACWVHLLHRDGSAHPWRIPELDDAAAIVDAAHADGVLIVIAHRGGSLERWVFRFPDPRRNAGHYDARRAAQATDAGAEVVSLPRRGLALSPTGEGALEVFSTRVGSTAIRRFGDGTLDPQDVLFEGHERVLVATGNQLAVLRTTDS